MDSTIENELFGGLFGSASCSDNVILERRNRFISEYGDVKFLNENYVLYGVLRSNNPAMKFTDSFLKVFMQCNRASLLSTNDIDLTGYASDTDDAYSEFCNCVLVKFHGYQALDITDDAFATALAEYKMSYVAEQTLGLLETGAEIITSGVKVGRRTLAGFDDMNTSIKDGLTSLSHIIHKSKRRGLIQYGVDSTNVDDGIHEDYVCRFNIKPLDDVIGGLYTGDMVSILAPTKGGKTRFCVHVIHDAMVTQHCNCLIWPAEPGITGWKSQIRAKHFDYIYNSSVTDAFKKHTITDKMIRRNALSPEMKTMEQASWTDLQYNDKYGKFSLIDEDLEPDTFLDIISDAIERTNSKLICIDYLQLLQDPRKNNSDVISAAYKQLLRLIKSKHVTGIFPAQFKQTAVEELGKFGGSGGKGETPDSRTFAGKSYEVIETPDINIGLYATEAQLADGFMWLYSIPSRSSPPFAKIPLNVEFGCCNYVPAEHV